MSVGGHFLRGRQPTSLTAVVGLMPLCAVFVCAVFTNPTNTTRSQPAGSHLAARLEHAYVSGELWGLQRFSQVTQSTWRMFFSFK